MLSRHLTKQGTVVWTECCCRGVFFGENASEAFRLNPCLLWLSSTVAGWETSTDGGPGGAWECRPMANTDRRANVGLVTVRKVQQPPKPGLHRLNTKAREATSQEHYRAILETFPKVLVFLSFYWAVALCCHDLQFEAGSLGYQQYLGGSSIGLF